MNTKDVVQIQTGSAGNLWQEGFNAYMDGAQFEDMTGEMQQRGWRAARRAEGDALGAMLVDSICSAAYGRGKVDFKSGVYNPPSWTGPDYADYLRGWNDEWAVINNRTLVR